MYREDFCSVDEAAKILKLTRGSIRQMLLGIGPVLKAKKASLEGHPVDIIVVGPAPVTGVPPVEAPLAPYGTRA